MKETSMIAAVLGEAFALKQAKRLSPLRAVVQRSLLALCCLVALCIVAPASGQQPASLPKIRVVMDDNYPPYAFRDSVGDLQGIIIDQWHAWEKKTGIAVEIYGMDWAEALKRMEAGEFDVIDTIFKNAERAAFLDFSKPYATLQVPIFFKTTISGITDVASLRGFPVAVKEGDASMHLLQANGIGPLLLYNNYESIVTAASERKVNVFVADKPPALYFLHKQGIEADFHISPPISVGEFHRAVRKGNASLLQVIEKGFDDVGTAEFSRIEKKWVGQTLSSQRYLRYLGYIVLAGVAVTALLLGLSALLARLVKKRTRALREREEQLRLYAQHSPAAIAMLDRDMKYLVVSRRWMTDYRLSDESVVGRSHYEVFPEVTQRWKDIHQRCLTGEIEKCDEEPFSRMDGRTDWIRWEIQPWRQADGSIGGLIMFTEDVTVRRQVTEMIRESEARLIKAFRSSPVALTIARLSDQRLVELNDAFSSLLGWTRAEAVDRSLIELAVMDEEAAAGLRRSLDEKRSVRDMEVALRARNGETLHAIASMETIEFHGEPHVVATFVDITGRRKAEQRVRQLNRLYAVMSGINETIVREKSLETLLTAACRIAVEKGLFGMAWIGLLDSVTGRLQITAQVGATDETLKKLEAIIEDIQPGPSCAVTAHALLSGEHSICNDIETDPEAAGWRADALSRHYLSMASLPLKSGDKTIGVFNLYADTAQFFDADEMSLLDELAIDISFALDINRREMELREADKRFIKQRKALIELTRHWGSDGDDALLLLRKIAEGAAQTLSVSRVSIWRYNTDRSAIRCVDLFEWEDGRHSSGLELSATTHPAYFRALVDLEMIVADDAATDPSTREFFEDYLRPHGIQSMLDVPIVVGGFRTGVLCLEHLHTQREWTADEKTFALAMSNLVSLALEGVERRQAETLLRESEKRFRQFAETIEEVFWMTDPGGSEMIYVSPAYEKIWHRTCASLYADPLSWLETVHPDDRERLASAIAVKRSRGEYDERYRILRTDGTVRWIHDRAFPVRDSHGTVLRIVGTAEDITESKQVEAQLLRSQRMESIGTLAGGIAHDLNNVLTPIMMSIELLKLQEKDPRRLSILSTIDSSAKRGADMVQQVLSFARGVEGRQIAVKVGRLVKEIEKITDETFLKNIQIQSAIQGHLWGVQGDPTQLHQVLLNLCVNARDAMPDGGMLKLSASNVTLDDHCTELSAEAKPGPHVLLEVEDNGSGMPAEVMERIFEPFFTTKEPGKGTGLGLSTTLAIIKGHQGFMRVQSEVGKGTKFQVYLPANNAESMHDSNPVETEMPRGNGELVLVVDDEITVRQIIKQTLEAFGYNVLLAADGVEASTLFTAHQKEVAVVLTDMMMPVMDGLATIQVLLRMNPQLHIIAASGLSVKDMVARATAAGVKHFIPKPYSAETLLKTLAQVLRAGE